MIITFWHGLRASFADKFSDKTDDNFRQMKDSQYGYSCNCVDALHMKMNYSEILVGNTCVISSDLND
jgi:hypothetical protein